MVSSVNVNESLFFIKQLFHGPLRPQGTTNKQRFRPYENLRSCETYNIFALPHCNYASSALRWPVAHTHTRTPSALSDWSPCRQVSSGVRQDERVVPSRQGVCALRRINYFNLDHFCIRGVYLPLPWVVFWKAKVVGNLFQHSVKYSYMHAVS